jgi:transcriptional regulator with GAF, ATPase, and Fis domain
MQAQIDVAVRAAAEAAAGAEAARSTAAAAALDTARFAVSLADSNESQRTSAARLLRSIRALDETTSLSQTLDALAAAARAEAERMALFLVRGEVFRAWSHAGFDAVAATPAFEVPTSQAGIAADAVRTVTSRRVTADTEGRPAFARHQAAGAFAAVPLTMDGQVIAVLCAEQPAATDEGETLTSRLEVLARHAARVLESLTTVRLAQLGAQPAGASSPSSPSPPQ